MLATACVSGPSLRQAPRVEMRFGASPAPKVEKQAPPPPKAPEPQVETADPPAQASQEQLEIECAFRQREVRCEMVAHHHYAEARVTPRRFGRFALEAYAGEELVERLRFNFPLLGDTPSSGEEVEKGLDSTVRLEFPELGEVTRLLVRDRKTGEVFVFPDPAPLPSTASPD